MFSMSVAKFMCSRLLVHAKPLKYFDGESSDERSRRHRYPYPIAPGQQIKLDCLKDAGKLVANYVNIYGQDPHHTVCARNENGLKAG